MNLRIVCLVVVTASLAAVPAVAHHSFAMFDIDKTISLKDATVKDFQWTNPHSWLIVMAADGQGKTVEWSMETNSPGKLARAGWRATTVSPGDKITVNLHPLKDGGSGGQLVSIVLPDGKSMDVP